MNFEEQISAFMDGALSAEQETEFLHILSVSPEKRALFHSYMGVRSAITADARGTAVPGHLDRAVLGAAGAAMGGAAAGGAAAGGAAAGGAAAGGAAAGGAAAGGAAAGSTTAASGFAAAAGWWTASRVITAVILGLSLFGAGYFLPTLLDDTSTPDADAEAVSVPGGTTDDGTPAGIPAAGDPAASVRGGRTDMNPPETADAGPGSNGTYAASMTPSATGSASGRGGDGSDGRATGGDRATGGERIVYRNVYITRVDTVYLSAGDARGGIAAADAGSQTRTDGVSGTEIDAGTVGGAGEARVVRRVDTVSIALMQRVPNERPLVIREAPRQEMQFPLPGRFVVEVQREHLNTWPYIDYNRVGAERTQQQFAVSAGYMFDRNHTAGLMAGEKSFAMEYYRIQGDSLYLFQQQPALVYGGGFYRYSLPVTAGIVPEITLQLGGSDLGPVIGGRIGVQLIPFDNVSIILGANGALLAYRYKDKLFTSHSLGLSYGLRYRF